MVFVPAAPALIHPPFHVPGDLQVDYQLLLTETAHLLLQDCDADSLCQAVFEIIRGPFELDVYFHFLLSEDETHLHLASSGGREEARKVLGIDLAFGQAVCGNVAQRCEWMYLPDVQERSDEMTSLIRSFGVRCYTCQPLIINGQIIGTLSFGSCRRDSFNPEELDLFRLIAQQLNVVTERRRQNDHIRQLEQLATAGRMCATIAHEINNPLFAISNLLFLLKTEVPSEQGKQLVGMAEDQIVRLTETTQRTLDLFRGKQQEPQPVDLGAIATDLLANMRLPNGVSLRRAIDPQVLVRAIPGEVHQVLFNLITNAAQFSPQGGEITLTIRQEDGQGVVRIKDNGPGISEAMRAKLFKPFYTTRSNGGTGLGLWISREMVERVGGKLNFESEPTRSPGAEFTVHLPLAQGGQ